MKPVIAPTTAVASRLDGLLATWDRLGRDLSDPDAELTCEVFAELQKCYLALRGRGHKFDGTFAALMCVLNRQLADAVGGYELA